MSLRSRLRVAYLSYVAEPAGDRPVYRAMGQRPVRRIVELGVGLGQRAVRMIEVASLSVPVSQIQYTGVDLFEGRTSAEGPGMTLKMAHRLLKATGARVCLLPGDPFIALSQTANSLMGTDLVVISARWDPQSLARAWFFFPRMLGEGARVLWQDDRRADGSVFFRRVGTDEITWLADAAVRRRAA